MVMLAIVKVHRLSQSAGPYGRKYLGTYGREQMARSTEECCVEQHRDGPDGQGGVPNPETASERRGDNFKEFKDFYLEAKARFWR